MLLRAQILFRVKLLNETGLVWFSLGIEMP